ncbi:hypothetical protein [Natrinema sp. CBA1119]|uniref:hypothetical protein n=1 Tax=Natrinema sp. CBA1119 TaxID=1608465 RepID=UPI001C3F259E|nr:hypothetical protein [Natrinema sp. CBA1119]
MSTGAFSTASAERSVDVNTAGDNSAYLTITGNSSYVTNADNGETLTIDLGGPEGEDGGFNQNAIITLEDVVEITNNSADGESTTVGVSPEGASNDPTAYGEASLLLQDGNNNEAVVTFYVGKSGDNSIGSGSTINVGSGDSVYLDIEIGTTDDTLDDPGASTGDLTIVAN